MFLGMKYEECGKKRSCKRYNHRKGCQRKMIECKRVTHGNTLIEFQRVNENNTNIIHRYDTDPKIFSCQATEFICCIIDTFHKRYPSVT